MTISTQACPACGGELTDDVERTTTRLLASLDDPRRKILTDVYQGIPPEWLCSTCFLPAVSMMNGVRG